MFGCPKQAWHDAFAGIKAREGNGSRFGWEVVQGELAKIKHVVNQLPQKQRDIGMLVYAPDSAVSDQIKGRVTQLLWRDVLKHRADALKSYKHTTRLLVLVDCAIQSARRLESSSGERRMTLTEVAEACGMRPANFARDFGEEYDRLVNTLRDTASKALLVVDTECRAIRDRYRQAA